MKNSMRVALCGVSAALVLVLMFMTGLVPIATIALPALAGLALIPVTAQLGLAWGFGVYAATGVLSLILAPDREAGVYYLLFFGYYPVLTAVLGRIRSKPVLYSVKFLIFNAAVLVSGWIVSSVLGIEMEELPVIGKYTVVLLWVLANIMFILYDIALGRIISMYYAKMHEKLRKKLFRG